MSKSNERRQPAQQRSRKRVDAILSAAKQLIIEKGSAQLKIQEIAQRADVTPASIYQYFPSKNAITHALAEQIFASVKHQINDRLPQTHSAEEAFQVLRELVDALYQLYVDEPALYDVWICISADKTVQDMDLNDSREISDLVFRCLKPYYPEPDWAKISKVSFLLAHLAGAAVRMAVSLGKEEGGVMLTSFKSLLSPRLIETMLQENDV